MKKAELIAMGVAEDVAEKVEEASRKELEGYVEIKVHNALQDEKEKLEKQNEKLTTDLEVKKEIETEVNDLKEQVIKLEDEKKDLSINTAIKLAVAGKAQDVDIVAGLIDKSKLKVGEDGKIGGLDEQIASLSESKGFLFKADDAGFKIGADGDNGNSGKNVNMTLCDAVGAALAAQGIE